MSRIPGRIEQHPNLITEVMMIPQLKILIGLLNVHFAFAFRQDKSPFEYIDVNCNDPTIRTAVDQQIIDFQNNNPSFFTTKAEEICPHGWFGFRFGPRIPYATLKSQTERNICFERQIKQLQVPAWCSQLAQQNNCSSPFLFSCGTEKLKRSYCKIDNWKHGPSNIDNIVDQFVLNARCEDIDPSANGVVKNAFDSFLANPANYIENELTLGTTLENKLIWYECVESYFEGRNMPTFLNCESRVTAAEQQTMRQRINWWNSRQSDAKEQLKNAAIAANDARKFLCLYHYENRGFRWGGDGALKEYVRNAKQQLKWSANRVAAPEAQQTMNFIETSNYGAIGYPPGMADPNDQEPTPEQVYTYQKKMDGACKGLYDKYDPALASTPCAPYQAQLASLSNSNNRPHNRYGSRRVYEDLLKSNNYNVQLALCMMRTLADRVDRDQYSGVQKFCFKLKDFVKDRQLNAIYPIVLEEFRLGNFRAMADSMNCKKRVQLLVLCKQRPDCNLANQRAGITFVELGSAIVNRQYETVNQLKGSIAALDPFLKASFDACLTDFVMVNLNQRCMIGQYATRTNSIKAFVEQTMADSNLSKKQKADAILGKLLEGPNKGDGMIRLCDQFAVVDGSTNQNERQKRAKLMKMKIMKTLKKLKVYQDLATLQPAQDCQNVVMLGNPLSFDQIYNDDDDDDYEDFGLDFSLGMRQIGLHDPWLRGRCLDGQNNKNKACWKNQFCRRINQVSDQTCNGMTNTKTTVDNEWENIMNAAGNVDFNFYTELKNMVTTVRTRLLAFVWPQGPPAPNTRTCVVKLMAKKLQAYWNPVNECHVQYFVKKILSHNPWFDGSWTSDHYGPHDDTFTPDDSLLNPIDNSPDAGVWPFDDVPNSDIPVEQPNTGTPAVFPFSDDDSANAPVWPFDN